MEYTTLGQTGLEVSRIGVGCMSLGRTEEWFLSDEESAASDLPARFSVVRGCLL